MYIAEIYPITLEDAYKLRKLGNYPRWRIYGNVLGINKRGRRLTIIETKIVFFDDDRVHIRIIYHDLLGGTYDTSEGPIYSFEELKMKYPKLFTKNGKMWYTVFTAK